MTDFEKLGLFYLGKEFDSDARRVSDSPVLYDARDLTTHAVIVGMTGSGKTGLGVTLLEEAAIDGIPAIIIDPKGDMGNLLLSFPRLAAEDFRPWINADEAERKEMSLDEFAADRAELWKKGLAEWGQDAARIERYRDAAEAVIYTPASDAGLPLTVLKSLAAPSAAVRESADALREHVSAAASGLCSLLGLDADPIRSREHILLANILDRSWREGRSFDMSSLIQEIHSPSFQKVGLMDVDQFFPPDDRMALATTLNNLLASPGFSGWMQGEPLRIERLLHSPEGAPRLSVLSIAHLSEQERMFFVTILLSELIAWMRSQPGTSSLRAILYMDEVFGYLPPTANPPSKTPLLTLLKQARAYGLGIVLATQNPVDLDYKALSNAGTWFLGRLQTERDKLRVLDGLEGAAAGGRFDRAQVDRILSGLSQRVFLMSNAHEDHPLVFQTRWALSYLAGPMTREQIRRLMEDRRGAAAPAPPPAASAAVPGAGEQPPLLPESIPQRCIAVSRSVPRGAEIVYRPALVGIGKVHFVSSKSGIDVWRDVLRVRAIEDDPPSDPWGDADVLDASSLELGAEAAEGAKWAELPSDLTKASKYKSWAKQLKEVLYRDCRLTLHYCESLEETSRPGQSEGDFRAALRHAARERRDQEVEELRAKYARRIARQQEVIRTAERRVGAESEQAQGATTSAWLSTGASILRALFGRKVISTTNIGRVGTAARAHSRAAQQKADVTRAAAKLDDERAELIELEAELSREVDELASRYDVESLSIETREAAPRKSDITIGLVALLWRPWRKTGDQVEPAWDQTEPAAT